MPCLRVILHLVAVIAHLTVMQSHTCVFKKRPDPSRGGELRWSLPRPEICYCIYVAAPQYWPSCPGNDNYNEGDLWFVVDLGLLYQLTLSSNWQKEILDDLLQRTEYCDNNECITNADNCHENAECGNIIGSFVCTCNGGYTGDGVSCEDINECTLNTHNCHEHAMCSNTIGSFNCTCNDGYSDDGVSCEDINECTTNTDNCHNKAECSNSIGSFNCTCNDGYNGDGVSCEDIQVCYDYMGLANGDIPNANMQASSVYGYFSSFGLAWPAAYNGRLNNTFGWMPSSLSDVWIQADNEWIQADIGYQTFVSGVVTQGKTGGRWAEWVASFKVSTFASSGSTEIFVMNGTRVMIFPGNIDSTSLKTSYLPEPVYAQIVRITCVEKGDEYYGMRFEILGCKND